MKRLNLHPGVLITLVSLAGGSCVQAQVLRGRADTLAIATISGVVRDTDGVPQMGALVQAISSDLGIGASATTDSRGRYRITLRPGDYRLNASAALLIPAIREHLRIGGGSRTVVDLTLSTLLTPAGWLPASKRTSAEPGDDWMWTLRSSGSRPILRLDDSGKTSDVNGEVVAVSSSAQESRRGAAAGSLTLKNSDGGFARGGSHSVLVLTRVNEDGTGAVLRADLSGPRTPYPVAPSAEVSAGLERQSALLGSSRLVLTYSSHPELTGRQGTGVQGATLRSAHRINLGDSLRVDAGSVVRDSNMGGNAFAVEPFLRIAARPNERVVFAYSMTHSRGTESLDDLDRVQATAPIAIVRNGHARLEGGSHHALSVAGRLPGKGTLEIALYRDAIRNVAVNGRGTLAAADLQSAAVIADPTTSTYRVAAADYRSGGVRASLRQPLTHSLTAGAEVVTGRAIVVDVNKLASLADVQGHSHSARGYAATAFVDGKVLRTGTTIRSAYRWQPEQTLTPIDFFRVGDDGAYLSCAVRQSLGKLRFVPQGLEAVLDVQNLLSQGYQSFVSTDGQTLYLAQTPRTLQAGLAFSF